MNLTTVHYICKKYLCTRVVEDKESIGRPKISTERDRRNFIDIQRRILSLQLQKYRELVILPKWIQSVRQKLPQTRWIT